MTMRGLRVQLDCAIQNAGTPTGPQFDKWTDILSEYLERNGNICVRVVSSAEMEQLNSRFRGKSGLTNVLSFPADINDIPAQALQENEDLRHFLGDIAICADVVNTESRSQNKPPEAHWAHLFVHGVLHLCGYDHVEDADADLMEDLETHILLAMGYAAPYSDNNEIATRVS